MFTPVTQVVALAALLSSVIAFAEGPPAREWTFTLPTGDTGSFTATETVTTTTITGDFDRLGNSFAKLTVTGATGFFLPTLGTSVFGFEVPGFAFFSQPLQTQQTRLIPAVASGACPTSPWNGVWVFSQFRGSPGSSSDVSDPTLAAFGTFSWNPATSTASITDARNLTSYATLSSFSTLNLAGTCTNGKITFSGDGDRGGTLYMTTALGAILQMQTNRQMFVIPQATIPAASNLNGDYATFLYDHERDQTIKGARLTISGGTSASGDSLTDIEAGTPNTAETWALTGITINNPFNGVFRGTLSLEGGATANALCTTYLVNKAVLYCAAQTPGNTSKPLSLVLVSDNQPIPPATGDSYTFGGGLGYVNSQLASGADAYPFGLTLQADGKILIGATDRYNTSNKNFAVARYLRDGTLDTSFNSTGVISHSMSSDDTSYAGIALDASGRIYQAGYSTVSSVQRATVVRYTSSGSLDSTFGSGGVRSHSFNGTNPENAYGIALDTSSRIYLALNSGTTSNGQFGIARLGSDGALDTSFNGTGYRFTNVNARTEGAFALTLQSDGKPIVVGYSTPALGNTDWMVVRYLTTGGIDSGFASSGIATTTFSNSSESARGIVVQGDGKIIVVGGTSVSGKQLFAVARYTSAGALDTTFGTSGRFTSSLSPSNESAYAAALQTNGRIFVTGYGTTTQSVGALLRLTTAGALDTSFNSSGKMIDSLLGIGRAVAIQTDEKIVFAGQGTSTTPRGIYVKRLWP